MCVRNVQVDQRTETYRRSRAPKDNTNVAHLRAVTTMRIKRGLLRLPPAPRREGRLGRVNGDIQHLETKGQTHWYWRKLVACMGMFPHELRPIFLTCGQTYARRGGGEATEHAMLVMYRRAHAPTANNIVARLRAVTNIRRPWVSSACPPRLARRADRGGAMETYTVWKRSDRDTGTGASWSLSMGTLPY